MHEDRMRERDRARRESGGAGSDSSIGRAPVRQTLVDQRYGQVQRQSSAGAARTGERERLPFLDVLASAGGPGGVQMQPASKPAAAKTPKGTTPLVVHVYHRGGKVTTWRGVTDLADLAGSAYYGGKGDDGGWSWNSDLGEMIDLYKDENDRSPTPISALMERGSVEFVSIHIGAKEFPIPDGKQVAELSGAKKQPKKKRTGPIDPDRALFGDSDDRSDGARRDAAQDGPSGGLELGQTEGVADATGTRHRDGGGDVLVGDDDAQASDGADAVAALTGDSQGTRTAIVPDKSGDDVGRKKGPVGGSTGNASDTGRKGGRRDGVAGDRASIAHNPNAELAPGPGGNIPEDGGSRDGMAGGEEGGKKGGLPGSIGLLALFTMSATTAGVVHLGQVLSDADLAGAADKLIEKAGKLIAKKFAKRAAKRALAQLAKEQLDTLVDEAMERIEERLADVAEWSQLDEAAKKQLRARWRYELSDEAPKALKRHLKGRIAALDEVVGDGEFMAERLGADEFLDEMVRGYRLERDELKDIADAIEVPKVEQGDAAFRGLGGEKYVDEAREAAQWARASAYWTDTATHDGMKVYRRNDLFDPSYVRDGETNLQRMKRGRAPVGHDQKPVELHHLNQADEGPVVEIMATFHDQHHKTIHINDNTIPSGIDRPGFESWKRGYWKARADELAP